MNRRTFRGVALAFWVAGLLIGQRGTVAAQFPPERFTNLRVLPENIRPDSLVGLMGSFTRALGVRCTFCHVGEESQPLASYDFASDDKPMKRRARVMLGMVQRINGVELAALEERASPSLSVQCMTCHRGARQPRMLQDVLFEADRTGGVEGLLGTYDSLRSIYYGRFVYDFSAVPLADVGGDLARRGRFADAERVLDRNVTDNPTSEFAIRQLTAFSLIGAFLQGETEGRARYAALRDRLGGDPLPEAALNQIGYELLRRKVLAGAVAALKLNAEMYARSSNAHDSLGEAYAANGQTELAIRSYQESLRLDPTNTNAEQKIRELRARR